MGAVPQLERWPTNNPYTFTVASNMNYTAIFAPTAVLNVLANPTNGGNVTGGGTYVVGSNALITATATNLWQFMGWADGPLTHAHDYRASGGATYTATSNRWVW